MHTLSWMICSPILGAILIALLGREIDGQAGSFRVVRGLGLLASAVSLGLSLSLLWHFQIDLRGYQFVERVAWLPSLGVFYEVGVDGISLCLVLLTTILMPFIIFVTAREQKHLVGYVSGLLLLETALLGSFCAVDLVLFYAFYELMLAPVFFLIGVYGGPGKNKAAFRFVLFTVGASVFMLASIIYVGWSYHEKTGELSFSLPDILKVVSFSGRAGWLACLGFLFAFLVKAPLFPFHTWLPSAYGEAPAPVTAAMSGLMAKVGVYGLLRFSLALFPIQMGVISASWVPLIACGILFTALMAWVQRDLKQVFAYSSVSHIGVMILAIAAATSLSLSGAVFGMISHGIVSVGIFLTLGVISSKLPSLEIAELGGLAERSKLIAVTLFIFVLGIVAVPLSSSFVGEFLSLSGSFRKFPTWTVIASISVVLSAVYALSAFRRVMFGAVSDSSAEMPIPTAGEVVPLIPLAVLMLFLGIFPQSLFSIIQPSVEELRFIMTQRQDMDSQESSESDHISEDTIAAPLQLTSSKNPKEIFGKVTSSSYLSLPIEASEASSCKVIEVKS